MRVYVLPHSDELCNHPIAIGHASTADDDSNKCIPILSLSVSDLQLKLSALKTPMGKEFHVVEVDAIT